MTEDIDRALRWLAVDEPTVVELRVWFRIADVLRLDCTRLANRIRQQLWRHYPQIPQLDDPTAEKFLTLSERAQPAAKVVGMDELPAEAMALRTVERRSLARSESWFPGAPVLTFGSRLETCERDRSEDWPHFHDMIARHCKRYAHARTIHGICL